MSEFSGSDFIHTPSFREHVLSQKPDHQQELLQFYQTFCLDRHGKSDSELDGRQGKFPIVLGRIWTLNHTLYALSATPGANNDPADYLLAAAFSGSDGVRTEELDIAQIKHIQPADGMGLDKIVDARSREIKAHITLRFGRAASVLTCDTYGNLTHSPSLPIG